MALGTGVAFRPTVAANRQSSYCRVEYSGSKSSSALSFVKVQKTVKSRGDVMEEVRADGKCHNGCVSREPDDIRDDDKAVRAAYFRMVCQHRAERKSAVLSH